MSSENRKLRALVLAQQQAIRWYHEKLYDDKALGVSEKISGAQSGTFETHHNGDRPFVVKWERIDAETIKVRVYKYRWVEGTMKCEIGELLYTFIAEDIFIGVSPHDSKTYYSLDAGPQFDGNSILVQVRIRELEYVWIGHIIYSFTANSAIMKFVSPIGNNDVPYSYAIDIDGSYYLLSDGFVVLHVPKYYTDPYNYYYRANLITADIGMIPPRQPLEAFENIVEWYIGDEQYTMRFAPDVKEDYEQLTNDDDDFDNPRLSKSMYIVHHGSTEKEVLTQDDYIALMERFGRYRGFRKMRNMKKL